tara:strand:+ start:37254 stop:40103 length:2850 start_codon:yes stop_codon:yes gene_type:complete
MPLQNIITAYSIRKLTICIFSIILIILFSPKEIQAQDSGVMKGVVRDSTNNELILGANIFILDLSKGAATNTSGVYEIKNIPAGIYEVRFSYIGYITKTISVTIKEGEVTNLSVLLEQDIFEGEEITVLAQAAGQVAAIKQQLESNTIVNVVSKERLSELPDQNAAESVARLPGVSVQRDAGEASKVVVRGLSPRFNSITVNGIRLPGSGDDRSVDLSLVPSEILGGIEVFKALTPDKDGDAVGGTVNLLVRKASNNFRGSASAETGYNDLRSDFGQYKFSTNLSDRFFDDKLGVLVSGSIQRANRASELFDDNLVADQADSSLRTENLNLADTRETRDKYGLSASLDFQIDNNNELFFSSLFGKTNRDEQRYRKRYRVGNTRTEYDSRDRKRFETIYSNSLSGRHKWDFLEVDWQSSYSYSLGKTPYSNYARFIEIGAFRNGLDDTNPDSIVAAANNDLDETFFQYGTFNTSRRTEDDFTAAINTQINFDITRQIDGYFKVGAKYRDKSKFADENEIRTDFGVVSQIGQDNPDDFDLYNSTDIAISNFTNSDYTSPTINGRFFINPGLDADALADFYSRFSNFYEKNRVTDLSDYEAGESITAFYAMMELNFGSRFSLLPGFRYEYTENFYSGNAGKLRGNLGQTGTISDTTGRQNYSELLPQIHFKVKIIEGIDIRLAYTKSLARPNYDNLVPFQNIDQVERTLSRGNPNLKHTTAINYDAFISFYKNSLGYFSVGFFYKELENIDYIRTTRVREGQYEGYTLTSPVNAEGTSTVKGVEFDLQTDFRYLPKPFNGLILSTNIAFINSETFFPVLLIGPRSPDPPFAPTIIDTVRAGKIPGQPDVTASFTLGYEIGLFSARASLAYQQDILDEIAVTSFTDGLSEGFNFWDFRLNQSFKNMRNLTFFLNINNVLSESEREFVGSDTISRKSRDFSYGLTASTGIKVKF